MPKVIAKYGRAGEEHFKEQVLGRAVMASRSQPNGEYPSHWKPSGWRTENGRGDNQREVAAGHHGPSGAGSEYPSTWGASVRAAGRTGGVRVTKAGA